MSGSAASSRLASAAASPFSHSEKMRAPSSACKGCRRGESGLRAASPTEADTEHGRSRTKDLKRGRRFEEKQEFGIHAKWFSPTPARRCAPPQRHAHSGASPESCVRSCLVADRNAEKCEGGMLPHPLQSSATNQREYLSFLCARCCRVSFYRDAVPSAPAEEVALLSQLSGQRKTREQTTTRTRSHSQPQLASERASIIPRLRLKRPRQVVFGESVVRALDSSNATLSSGLIGHASLASTLVSETLSPPLQ